METGLVTISSNGLLAHQYQNEVSIVEDNSESDGEDTLSDASWNEDSDDSELEDWNVGKLQFIILIYSAETDT